MLVITRRVGERIFVAPNVWIVLVDVRGVSAKIGVEAPYEVRIKREEHVTERDIHPLPRSAELPPDSQKGA
jgi:carbon storage regulator CsrA